jgi:hypothetical protein
MTGPALWLLVKSRLFFRPSPQAMTFAGFTRQHLYGDRVASGEAFPNSLWGRLPMFYPCTAFAFFLVRRAAPAAPVLACPWSTPVQSQPPVSTKHDRPAALPQSVEVFGKVVDAETDKPVEAFITQAGKFDPQNPKNVNWGFSETRSTSGNFSATITWNEGWTPRILADGYVPQPVVSEAPPPEKTESRQ